MPNPDRRERFLETFVIDIALELASLECLGRALDYMFDNGIAVSVAYRVLTDPEFQRRNAGRRKGLRQA
jgi:hypothetical protein